MREVAGAEDFGVRVERGDVRRAFSNRNQSVQFRSIVPCTCLRRERASGLERRLPYNRYRGSTNRCIGVQRGRETNA